MAAESKDLFAFRRGFTDLLPNRSLDYARDDSLVKFLKQIDKLPICSTCILQQDLFVIRQSKRPCLHFGLCIEAPGLFPLPGWAAPHGSWV